MLVIFYVNIVKKEKILAYTGKCLLFLGSFYFVRYSKARYLYLPTLPRKNTVYGGS